MNRSGYAARCFVERHGLEPAAMLVVYDEINLPLGKLRLRSAGSPAGHRGLESVIENLRTDRGAAPAPRRRPGGDGRRARTWPTSSSPPSPPDERETVDEMIRRAADACEAWVREGVDAAMGRFNG